MHDLLIENARIIDGTGSEAFHGSVAVRDGQGIHATVVNGGLLMRDGEHQGELPGQILRSGAV